MSLNRIRIVLVAPTHSGNIGACARAMKNMGLHDLHLVTAAEHRNDEAIARAAGAEDILEAAREHDTLDAAISDCQLIVGTSARERRIAWPIDNPGAAAGKIVDAAGAGRQVAILFGQERTGLTNEQLDRCHALVTIPTAPDYPSLNLASAVQVIAYEIYRTAMDSDANRAVAPHSLGEPAASHADIERFYRHLEDVLVELKFLDPGNPRYLMRRLIRLFNRTDLTINEVNILRGILTAVQTTKGSDRS